MAPRGACRLYANCPAVEEWLDEYHSRLQTSLNPLSRLQTEGGEQKRLPGTFLQGADSRIQLFPQPDGIILAQLNHQMV